MDISKFYNEIIMNSVIIYDKLLYDYIKTHYNNDIYKYYKNTFEECFNQIQLDEAINNISTNENIEIIIQCIKKYMVILTYLLIDFSGRELVKVDFTKLFNIMEDKTIFNPDFLTGLIKYKEDIMNNIKTKNLEQDKIEEEIMIYIVNLLKNDTDLINIVNDEIFNHSEINFIDVIVNNNTNIDKVDIENVLTKKDHYNNTMDDILELINDADKVNITNDYDKINSLIKSKLLYPITNEFMLYHSDSEVYGGYIEDELKEQKENKLKFDYYIKKISDGENNLENAFNSYDSYKKAVFINHLEDVTMMNKMSKYFTQAMKDNMEKLTLYKKSVYVNFNNHLGLFIKSPINCVSVRNSSFILKSQNGYKIQYRSCLENNMIDLMGFALIHDNIQNYDTMDIKNVSYEKFINEIYNKLLGNDYEDCFWILNIKDKKILNSFININEDNRNDKIYIFTLLLNKLYDDIISFINDTLFKLILNNKNITIEQINNKIQNIFKLFNDKSDMLNIDYLNLTQLDKQRLLNIIKQNKININKDELYGLNENSIKLINYKIEEKRKVNVLNTYIKEKKIIDEDEDKNILCYHYLLWEQLDKLKQNNITKYEDMFEEFVQKYSEEVQNGVYICKSCGQELVELQKMVQDGKYNNNKQFITSGSHIYEKLEDLTEYKKWGGNDGIIKNMLNVLDKLGSIIGLKNITGSNLDVKKIRDEVVRKVIDFITANNILFDKKSMETRKIKSENEYGIYQKLTDFYIFDLDNSIFKGSETDADIYKSKKYNNLIIYTLVILIINMDESQIFDISKYSKFCSYASFKKNFKNIFGKIKIKLENTIESINKYPILCYIIYTFACSMSRYNSMYKMKEYKNDKVTRIDTTVMAKIIYSVIDTMNAIIENYVKISTMENTSHLSNSIIRLYKDYCIKFTYKLNEIFANYRIQKDLEDPELEQIDIDHRFKDRNELGNYKDIVPEDNKYYQNTGMKTKVIDFAKNAEPIFGVSYINEVYSNKTLCLNGLSHEWDMKGSTLICTNCNKTYDEIIKNDENIDYKKRVEIKYLEKMAKSYCISNDKNIIGNPHLWNKEQTKCILCGYTKDTEYKESELLKLKKYLFEQPNEIKQTEKKEKNKINKNFTYDKDSINKFIERVKDTQGSEVNIINKDINIDNNIYIFLTNHLGFILPQQIEILEKNIKIEEKHPKFKQKTISYINNKIETYYSAETNKLLGYKDASGQIIENKLMNNYNVNINYSLYNEIIYLLFNSIYSSINNRFDIDYIYDNMYSNACNFIINFLKYVKYIQTQKEYVIDNKSYLKDVNSEDNQNVNLEFDTTSYYPKLHKIKLDNIFDNWREKIKLLSLKRSYNYKGYIDNKIINNEYISYIFDEINKFILLNKSYDRDCIVFIVHLIDYVFNINKFNLQNNPELVVDSCESLTILKSDESAAALKIKSELGNIAVNMDSKDKKVIKDIIEGKILYEENEDDSDEKPENETDAINDSDDEDEDQTFDMDVEYDENGENDEFNYADMYSDNE